MLEYDRLLDAWLDDDGIYDGMVEVDVDTGEAKKVLEINSTTEENKLPIELQQQQAIAIQNTIIGLKEQLKIAEEQQKEVNEQLLKLMQENNVEQLQLENVTIIRKHESIQQRLDTKKLEKEMPDIANQFKKDVKVGEHIEIRIKK